MIQPIDGQAALQKSGTIGKCLPNKKNKLRWFLMPLLSFAGENTITLVDNPDVRSVLNQIGKQKWQYVTKIFISFLSVNFTYDFIIYSITMRREKDLSVYFYSRLSHFNYSYIIELFLKINFIVFLLYVLGWMNWVCLIVQLYLLMTMTY